MAEEWTYKQLERTIHMYDIISLMFKALPRLKIRLMHIVGPPASFCTLLPIKVDALATSMRTMSANSKVCFRRIKLEGSTNLGEGAGDTLVHSYRRKCWLNRRSIITAEKSEHHNMVATKANKKLTLIIRPKCIVDFPDKLIIHYEGNYISVFGVCSEKYISIEKLWTA